MSLDFIRVNYSLSLIVNSLTSFHTDFDCLKEIYGKIDETNFEIIFQEIFLIATEKKHYLNVDMETTFTLLERINNYFLLKQKLKMEEILEKINNSLKNVDIFSIDAKCKSCGNYLKCHQSSNNLFEFYCMKHGLLKNISFCEFEMRLQNEIVNIRFPIGKLALKPNSVTICTNMIDCCPKLCPFAHSLSEQKVWETLRTNKIELHEFILKNLKLKGETVIFNNETVKIYSLQQDLFQFVKDGNIERLKLILKKYDQRILFNYDDAGNNILQIAVNLLDLEMIQFLLDHESLSNSLDNDCIYEANYIDYVNNLNHNKETAFLMIMKKLEDEHDDFNKQKLKEFIKLTFLENDYVKINE